MNILICDDERDCIDCIRRYVSLFMQEHDMPCEFYELSSGEEAVEITIKYDIAFLDIEMGGMNGIDVAKRLKAQNKSIVIFIITAYEKYLDDAMDLNILRFFEQAAQP